MAYHSSTHPYSEKKRDSLLQPSSHDIYGPDYSRQSRSSTRSDTSTKTPMSRHKSSHGHERRHYDYEDDYLLRSSISREETYPADARRARSTRGRRSWPPAPIAEDERQALTKEHPRIRPRAYSDEGCMRGTIDQNPVLIELENHERRYVLVPQDGKKVSSLPLKGDGRPRRRSSPTPRQNGKPTSSQLNQDERHGKSASSRSLEDRTRREDHQRSNRPELKVDVEESIVFACRQPSPYAFTKSPHTPSARTSAEFLQSPEAITPRHDAPAKSPDRRTRHAETRHGRSNGSSDDRSDSDLDPSHAARLRGRRHEARVSFTDPTSPPSLRPAIKRFSTDFSEPGKPRPYKAPTNQSSNLKNSIEPPRSVPPEEDRPKVTGSLKADSQAAFSSRQAGPGADRPKPLTTNRFNPEPVKVSRYAPADEERSRTQATASLPIPIPDHVRAHSAYGSRSSAKPSSPRSSAFDLGATTHLEGSYGSKPSTSSYQDSYRRSSRPSSPSIGHIDPSRGRGGTERYPFEQGNGFGGQAEWESRDQRPVQPAQPQVKPASRRSSRERPVTKERPAPSGLSIPPAPPRPILPYPIDDIQVDMPNHEHFQMPSTPIISSEMPIFDRIPQPAETYPKPSQPQKMPTRNATMEGFLPTASRPVKEAPMTIPTQLPACPRKEFSRDYDDWYTLRADHSFDVCPTCFDGIVRSTPFQKYFTTAPPRLATIRTRCDFGSPWFRLAWLLTIKRQRTDIDLIYALSAVAGDHPECSNARESTGPWHGLKEQNGKVIANFRICACDVKFIETLFPSMTGAFPRIYPGPGNENVSKQCSLRISSKRFPMYLDLLEDIDDDAKMVSGRVKANMQPLIDVALNLAYKQECPRDNPTDMVWHFLPSFPAFHLCEDCYDEKVWPSVEEGSDVANAITQNLRPLPPDRPPTGVPNGASCQMYSARMRRVWARAVKYGGEEGIQYLVRKVQERIAVEEDLRRQQVKISRSLEMVMEKGRSHGSADVKDHCKRELERIEAEWAEWE